MLRQLSKELTKEFGKVFSVSNIQFMRRSYQNYQIQQTVSVKLSWKDFENFIKRCCWRVAKRS